MGAPALATDKKTLAKDLDAKLRALVQAEAISDLEVGRHLKTIRDEELWVQLGAETFEDYCSTVAGLGLKRVSSRIRLWETYGKFELKPDDVVPSTKLRILIPVVTKANIRDWLKRAQLMSCAELVATVREERKKLHKGTRRLRGDEEPQVKPMQLGCTKSQLKTIRHGIDLAKARLKAKTNGEAVAMLMERGIKTLSPGKRRAAK